MWNFEAEKLKQYFLIKRTPKISWFYVQLWIFFFLQCVFSAVITVTALHPVEYYSKLC